MSMTFTGLLAIFGMALMTYATRFAGIYFMRGITIRGRMKAALDALPPAVLMAVITPMVLMTGVAETGAAAITGIAALLRLPLIVTITIGVISVVILRHFIA